MAQRTIGLARIEIGISGSGAVTSRSTKTAPITSATANSASTGSDSQA